MALLTIYKDGMTRKIAPRKLRLRLEEGWSTDKPEGPEVPTLELFRLSEEQLLHVAVINGIRLEPGATREDIEALLTDYWEGLGMMSGWLENSLAAAAPVPPEDVHKDAFEEDAPEPVSVEEHADQIKELTSDGGQD